NRRSLPQYQPSSRHSSSPWPTSSQHALFAVVPIANPPPKSRRYATTTSQASRSRLVLFSRRLGG
ncbi:hypothetical protein CP533_4598, partial [Ophiocordyceps camponoti-saundersi (nom. inval.)]